MRNFKSLTMIAMMAAVVGLTGCAYGSGQLGKTDTATIEQKLVKGKTTKAEVKSLLGEPTSTTRKNGKETWVYAHASMDNTVFIPFVNIFTAKGKTKEVHVEFNSRGIMQSYEVTEGTI